MTKRIPATTKKSSGPTRQRRTNRQSVKLSIVVVGAGGIGLALLPTLSRVLNYGPTIYQFDVAALSLVDGGSFEKRNRDRQHFTEKGNKAEVTLVAYREEFPNVIFMPHGIYLTKENIGEIITDNDVVFCCVDNHATRKLVSEHAESLTNITIISGGNELIDGNIQVFVRQNGENVTASLTEFHKEIREPRDENPAYAQQRESWDGKNHSAPQLLITNFNVAALMLNAFHAFLIGELGKYDEVHFDIRVNQSRAKNLRALSRPSS
jgi:molybdopterin/thiamine biosynthesis adenylyltransferase